MWAGAAALYHSIYIFLVAAILPMSLMIIFSLLARKNLRKMLRNVHPMISIAGNSEQPVNINNERVRFRQRDRQLSKMLFLQIIVYVFFTITYPIQTLYNAIVLIIGEKRSDQRVVIENFTLFLTSAFLANFYSAASFFVFLTSRAFRKELRFNILFFWENRQ
jgi:hypothetical protein